ncbi:MAG: hypothetical protein EB127_05310 [Alphaproteobacteria bacterium]|nr:hypothetical protein [Alphaproteobacteria bacterium]
MKKYISVLLIYCLFGHVSLAEDKLEPETKDHPKKHYILQWADWINDIVFWNPLYDDRFMNYLFGGATKDTNTQPENQESSSGELSANSEAIAAQTDVRVDDSLKPDTKGEKLKIQTFAEAELTNENTKLQNPIEIPAFTIADDVSERQFSEGTKDIGREIRDRASKNILKSDELNYTDASLVSNSNLHLESLNLDSEKETNCSEGDKCVVLEKIDELLTSLNEKEALDKKVIAQEGKVTSDELPSNTQNIGEKLHSKQNESNILVVNNDEDSSKSLATKETSQDSKSDKDISIKHGSLNLIDKEQAQKEIDSTVVIAEFVEQELAILLSPNDDVVLGEVSKDAQVENMDSYAYLKLFWKDFYHANSTEARNNINRYIEVLSASPPEFSSEEVQLLSREFTRKGEVENLRVLVDHAEIDISKDSECNFSLLQDAIEASQYNSLYYLIMKGAKVSNKLLDIPYINQRASPTMLKMLKKHSRRA